MAVHHKNIASNLSCEREKENYCPENEDNILESLSNNNYPKNYDKKVITRTGVEIFMRPIKPTDALLLLDMFNNLSPRTRFYRFFSPIKVLPKDLLIKFTQIDYNRDMALIALENNEPNSKILAVARFISRMSGWFDANIVDGLVNFTAFISGFIGLSFKKLQTGKVQTYVVFVVFSIIILLLLFKPF